MKPLLAAFVTAGLALTPAYAQQKKAEAATEEVKKAEPKQAEPKKDTKGEAKKADAKKKVKKGGC